MPKSNSLNILLIGSGGREDALAWKISSSALLRNLYIAPGNPGSARFGENVPIDALDFPALIEFARAKKIDLTVVGPEEPLSRGIVNQFEKAGLTIFGPTQAAARLESSKSFMKEILRRANAPTARYEVCENYQSAIDALKNFDQNLVVKADGLCAGKGVVVADNYDQAREAIKTMMLDRKFGAAGERIILEEKLDGEEASVFAFCDGSNIELTPAAQDHKRIFENDRGPNTGGMGAYSPAPIVTPEMFDLIRSSILEPTVATMAATGNLYKGILYAGLMIDNGQPKILEFNCRFGDPECQPLMARLKSDLVPIALACAEGTLDRIEPVEWSDLAALSVVMAANGYPGEYKTGAIIEGLDRAETLEDALIFHAGSKRNKRGQICVNGGRVLSVTGLGATIADAAKAAYRGVEKISWGDQRYRKDIGWRALGK